MKEISGMLFENYFTLSFAIGLVILFAANKTTEQRTGRYFKYIVLLVMVLDVSDILDCYLTGLSEPTVLRYITSAIGYTLRPMALVLIVCILLRSKKFGIYIWIPIIALAAISFTSYFTHLMFWFNERNYFMRGILSYLPHVISCLYMLLIVVLTFKLHRYISAGETVVVLYIVLLSGISTFLESTSEHRFLLEGTILICSALYYTFLCTQSFKRDTLTGLLNRRSFYIDIHSLTKDSVVVISIDMNGLKAVNDTMGHSSGDQALQTLAQVLLNNSNRDIRPYRTGGDEFMILAKNLTEAGANGLIEKIRWGLKETGLSVSFGYAFLNPGVDPDVVCNQADANMYKEKSQYKHRSQIREQ